MASRLELQEYFKTLTKNVYYQPPESVKMSYPAIRFSFADFDIDHADNEVYRKMRAYEVIYISKNPDDNVVEILSEMPLSRFNRRYVADGLYHNVFTIYY